MKAGKALLWPFSALYGAGARVRAWTYRTGIVRQKRLQGVVVSVGNVTVGGTGKTPMVTWLAEKFAESGRKVAVLARGYRPIGSGAGVTSRSGVQEGWNDEVALLSGRLGKRAQFGVGANRFEKGRELESRGINIFILDDGFQHFQLARDADVVMVDGMAPFGGGRVLPSGRLREPVSALRRADILVIHRVEKVAGAIEAELRRYSAAPIYFSQTKLLSVEPFGDAEVSALRIQGRRFFAFCGIGNPRGFLADLERWELSVAGYHFFRDHHRYTPADMISLSAEARDAGADALLCTEKDIYDLPLDVQLSLPVFFCKIGLQFNDEAGLWRAIEEKIRKKEQGRKR